MQSDAVSKESVIKSELPLNAIVIDKKRLTDIIVFLLYAVLTFIGALNHEIWFDEAQAWVIARDNDIPGIIEQLGYEGHPPLWYMILYVFSHLGFSCNALPFISWAISAATVYIILRCAPFKLWVKCSVIFSAGFLYFNTVISRTYCLINLFLVIIAALYPKRKEHPILYGLAVMGLANTHVCVSGFVGIIGIFMIYDLIKDFKGNTKKQNICNISGLLISGIGVLCLVLPLIGSAEKNEFTSNNVYTLKNVVYLILMTPYEVSYQFLNCDESFLLRLGVLIVTGCIYICIILQRHKLRSFAIIIVSSLFFAISSNVIWCVTLNRAHIYFVMLFAAMWIAKYEPEMKKFQTDESNICESDKLLIDKNYSKYSAVLISACFLLSVPTGSVSLFRDWADEFSPAKQACKFIEENLPEDSILVTYEESGTCFSAYLPNLKCYSLQTQDFYTFCSHRNSQQQMTAEEINMFLESYDNVYYLIGKTGVTKAPEQVYAGDVIYRHFGGVPWGGEPMLFRNI